MRRWVGQLAPVAAAGAVVWFLGAAVPWLLIWWSAASVLFLAGWIAGHSRGDAKAAGEARQWEALADELDGDLREATEGLAEARTQLARADTTIEVLHRNVQVAFDAGFVAGQTWRDERQEHGL